MTNAENAPENTRLFIKTAIIVIALFLITDAAWLPFSTISLYENLLFDAMQVAGVLIGTWLAAMLIEYRLQDDLHKTSLWLKYAAAAARTLVLALSLVATLLAAMTVFTYLASAAAAPFVDARLARVDAALGFDWPAFTALVNSSKYLSLALTIAYFSMAPQMALTVVFLALSLRRERLMEFIALLAVTALATCMLMAVWPAEGAYAFFRPSDHIHDNFSAGAGMWHHEILMELRSQRPFTMNAAEGLVTFPSFHTVVGILVAYALRGIRYIAWPAGFLNACMIIGTIPEGGHHLTDVVAGLALALTAIAVMRTTVSGAHASRQEASGSVNPEAPRS